MPTFSQIQDEISIMLAIPDEDLTDEQRKAMETYFDELGGMEAKKVDSFAQFVKIEAARAETYKEESKRLAQKAKSAEQRIGYLKARYTADMQRCGLKKISGDAYDISLRASDAVSVQCKVSELPSIYQRVKTTIEPEKTLLKEALKGGLNIPGCELVKTYSLQVR